MKFLETMPHPMTWPAGLLLASSLPEHFGYLLRRLAGVDLPDVAAQDYTVGPELFREVIRHNQAGWFLHLWTRWLEKDRTVAAFCQHHQEVLAVYREKFEKHRLKELQQTEQLALSLNMLQAWGAERHCKPILTGAVASGLTDYTDISLRVCSLVEFVLPQEVMDDFGDRRDSQSHYLKLKQKHGLMRAALDEGSGWGSYEVLCESRQVMEAYPMLWMAPAAYNLVVLLSEFTASFGRKPGLLVDAGLILQCANLDVEELVEVAKSYPLYAQIFPALYLLKRLGVVPNGLFGRLELGLNKRQVYAIERALIYLFNGNRSRWQEFWILVRLQQKSSIQAILQWMKGES